jgi:uncharacterized protein YndB with AHSA1/START domain
MAQVRPRTAVDTTPNDSTLVMRRRLPATQGEVFRMWTIPEHMLGWMCPTGSQVVEATVDLRVGGRYRIGMRNPEGQIHTTSGIYEEVLAPERLVFTWCWEDPGSLKTLVTVEFRALGDETELVLRHDRFADTGRRDGHLKGWVGCLGNLELYVGKASSVR